MALKSQGILDRFRRVWLPDVELRTLSRFYERKTQQLTAATNGLWKLLREVSPDLYLLFRNENPDIAMPAHVLTQQGVLTLLNARPDVSIQ